MLPPSALKELSTTLQTTEQNVRREYVQHLFLSYFYQQKEAQNCFFKGGTALRLVFKSPRFSEDLDFSAETYDVKQIESAILATLREIEREGIAMTIVESKETTGGYLASIRFQLSERFQRSEGSQSEIIEVLLQFSKRALQDKSEVVTIVNDFIPPYTLFLLDRERLVNEKIQALLTRAKPRDFYDVYFLLRSNLVNQAQKKLLVQVKKKLETTSINFVFELKQFLPKSHWPIIRDFAQNLEREVARFTP